MITCELTLNFLFRLKQWKNPLRRKKLRRKLQKMKLRWRKRRRIKTSPRPRR